MVVNQSSTLWLSHCNMVRFGAWGSHCFAAVYSHESSWKAAEIPQITYISGQVLYLVEIVDDCWVFRWLEGSLPLASWMYHLQPVRASLCLMNILVFLPYWCRWYALGDTFLLPNMAWSISQTDNDNGPIGNGKIPLPSTKFPYRVGGRSPDQSDS